MDKIDIGYQNQPQREILLQNKTSFYKETRLYGLLRKMILSD